MDGNGRWAQSRGLPRSAGHRQGAENLRRTLRGAVDFGIKVLTIYAFSTENWKRPKTEVRALMSLFHYYFDRELDELNRNGVQLRHSGQMEGTSDQLRNKIVNAVEKTKHNDRLILNVAFNYGGRAEIVDAVRDIVRSGIAPDMITEELISQHLHTKGLPDPDLIIRTSGEFRTSNFLIWQGAYAEYYVTPTLWPDFDKEELYKALVTYGERNRRYGGVNS
jgi:undecaprenyl diphosphate synthase